MTLIISNFFNPIPNLSELDRDYQKAITKFQKDCFQLVKAKKYSQLCDLFDDFGRECTIVPEFWEALTEHKYRIIGLNSTILKKGFSHFYSQSFYCLCEPNDDEPLSEDVPFLNCYYRINDDCRFLNAVSDENVTSKQDLYKLYSESGLAYPHNDLKNLHKNYSKNSYQPVSKEITQQYEKSLKYMKDCSFDYFTDNYSQWIENLFEIGGDKFAIQTIESVLAKNYQFKSLWKNYILSLRNRNPKVMLEVFARYTKFFLTDYDMKMQYADELQKIKQHQIKNFDYFPKLESYLFDKVRPPQIQPISKDLFSNHFYHVSQSLPFHATMISYLIKKASPELQHNLMKSCKQFSLKFSTPVCHRLVISFTAKATMYRQQSIRIQLKRKTKSNFVPNLRISNKFECNINNNRRILKEILPKKFRCEARYIKIVYQDLSFDDLKMLVVPKRVLELQIQHCNVIRNDGSNSAIDEIFGLVPYAKSVEIGLTTDVSQADSQRFAFVERKTKLENLKLGYFDETVEPGDFYLILTKFAEPKATCFINMHNSNHNHTFDKQIRTLLKMWKPEKIRPFYSSSMNRSTCLCINYEACNKCRFN